MQRDWRWVACHIQLPLFPVHSKKLLEPVGEVPNHHSPSFISLGSCNYVQFSTIKKLFIHSFIHSYARLPILTFFSKLLQVPDFWLKGHVNSGLRPFLGLFIKNWVSAPGYSAGTWFWSSACAGKFGKIDISRTTGPIKLADPSF